MDEEKEVARWAAMLDDGEVARLKDDVQLEFALVGSRRAPLCAPTPQGFGVSDQP